MSKEQYLITLHDTQYEIRVIDSTHLKFRIINSEQWAIPLHIQQLSDDMHNALTEQNAFNGNFLRE
jgi:hypothetical protein